MKKIPYGLTDLKLIIEEDYYYVDKTHFLPEIEKAGRFLFLIRPRRFGKSLWLATLELYYDLYYKKDAEKLLKNKWIGQHPTKEQSQYLVLKFNFSLVSSAEKNLESSFEAHCNKVYSVFCSKYRDLLPEDFKEKLDKEASAASKFELIYTETQLIGQKLYVIIDEYDNFANTILSEGGKDRYLRLTRGEGFFRHFFNKLKGATTGIDAPVTRSFITGVSPVTMDDVTSGYNIGKNITTDFSLNEIIGFTNDEVLKMLQYYEKYAHFDIEQLIQILSDWYNNYKFSKKANVDLFNSDMILYFIDKYLSENELPDSFIDDNAKTDYKKLQHLITLDRQLNGNFSILKKIYEEQEISSRLIKSFPVAKLLNKDCFISLLYYFGLLSISRVYRGDPMLIIPNHTIKNFWHEYIIEAYEKTDTFRIDIFNYSRLISDMAYRGDWQPVFDFLTEEIKKQSKIRDYINGEAMIKGFLMAYLSITDHYVLVSEKELYKGFADLYLEPFVYRYTDMPYSWLIEVKYFPRSEKDVDKESEKVKTKIEEAKIQLHQYEQDELVQNTKRHTTVRKLALVYHGWELIEKQEV